MAPKQTDPQFKLRMTPEIKEAIERSATANNRSMNAEILHRLQITIEADALDEGPGDNAHADTRGGMFGLQPPEEDLRRQITKLEKINRDIDRIVKLLAKTPLDTDEK